MSARVLHWFRTDLRLHDAPALVKGLELKPEAFFPVGSYLSRIFSSLIWSRSGRGTLISTLIALLDQIGEYLVYTYSSIDLL